jgi:flagellar biosynthetic protein FlhB
VAEESDSGQEKTEDPTSKRIEDFQQKGQFAQSREIASMGVLFCGLLFLYYGLRPLLSGVTHLMYATFNGLDRPLNNHSIALMVDQVRGTVGLSMLTFLLLLALISLVTAYGQVGWHPNVEALGLKLERLNPLPGIKRLFSVKSQAVELAKSTLKLAIVGAIGYQLLKWNIIRIVEMPRTGLESSLKYMGDLLYSFTLRCLMWLLVVAVLDLLWQRYSLHQKMMMTKQEVKDETKDKEGNPQVKGKMRAMARKRLQDSGLKNVAKADVVITNPDHYAIALKYTSGKMRAPIVVAKGQDRIAEAIKTEARRHGIPRIENRLLARTLYKLTRVGDEIPPDLYAAVAEILAFVYRLKHQYQQV